MNKNSFICGINKNFCSEDRAQLIEKIEPNYPTIVGLPLWRTAKVLEKQGIVWPTSVEEIYRVKPYANWKDFV